MPAMTCAMARPRPAPGKVRRELTSTLDNPPGWTVVRRPSAAMSPRATVSGATVAIGSMFARPANQPPGAGGPAALDRRPAGRRPAAELWDLLRLFFASELATDAQLRILERIALAREPSRHTARPLKASVAAGTTSGNPTRDRPAMRSRACSSPTWNPLASSHEVSRQAALFRKQTRARRQARRRGR